MGQNGLSGGFFAHAKSDATIFMHRAVTKILRCQHEDSRPGHILVRSWLFGQQRSTQPPSCTSSMVFLLHFPIRRTALIRQRTYLMSPHKHRAFQPSVRCNTVSFNNTVDVQNISGRSEMTRTESAQVYHSKKELRDFQLEGKQICKDAFQKARSMSEMNPELSLSECLILLANQDTGLRGFEAYISPAREMKKTLVKLAVHAYQNQLNLESIMTPEEKEEALAKCYSQLSLSSQTLALLTARNDAIDAYVQDVEIDSRVVPIVAITPNNQVDTLLSSSPDPKAKRRAAFVMSEPRQRRLRVTKEE